MILTLIKVTVTYLWVQGVYQSDILSYKINTSPIKEIPKLFLTKHDFSDYKISKL
jgi:hypothetical protein